jgi:hypothetical protein
MNLAKTHHIDSDPPNKKPGVDTVFARTTIVSDKDQVKKLQFGFTDLGKVYFNGQLLYSENNAFGSRDYRFMGLMRYANELYLPLRKGENDLTLAVTGLFASWGVQARLDDLEGVELTTAGEGFAFDKQTDDSCVASYSANENGKLHIPCVLLSDDAGSETLYEVDMYQNQPAYNFDLDVDSIVAKETKSDALSNIDTMQILMVSRLAPGVSIEQTYPYGRGEAQLAWDYYTAGTYRQMYGRLDGNGVVAMMEVKSIEEAHKAVSAMPMVKNGLVEYDLIPLGHFFPLSFLFENE